MGKYLLKTEEKGYGIDGEDGWRRKKEKSWKFTLRIEIKEYKS